MFRKVVLVSALCCLPVAGSCGDHGVSTGTIRGVFEEIGGPSNLGPRPLPGKVTLTSSTGKHISLDVGKSGRVTSHISPGTYTATGYSPDVHNGQGEMACQGLSPVVVHAGRSVRMTVACQVP